MPKMRLGKWFLAIWAVVVIAAVVLEVHGYGATVFATTEAVKVFLKQQKPISLNVVDQNLDSVYSFFDPSLQPYLRQVPIIFSNKAQTLYSFYRRDDVAYVAVNPEFFKTAQQSKVGLDDRIERNRTKISTVVEHLRQTRQSRKRIR